MAQVTETQQPLAIEGPTTVEFSENSTAIVATYRVKNAASGATISWSVVGTDARRLSIDSAGALRFKAAKNFEKPNDGNVDNEYEIDVSATVGSTHVSVEVAVTVTDVNEPPAFELESAEFSVEENASANRRVGRAFVVIDPDDGDSRTFSVEGKDAGLFHIDTEGQIRVRRGAVLDYEALRIFKITARVTDQGGLTDSLPVQISLTDADDPGVVTFSPAKPFIGVPFTATVSDQDGGVTGRIRWRWHRAMNADDEFEQIDGATRISYTPVEDDEGYILRVTVSYTDNFEDRASASGISAAVGRNTAPQFESESITLTVPEEAPAGTDVGDPVSATDTADDDLTYTLSGEDASYFEVDASTGQIAVGAEALPDSETKAGYTVIVTATDQAGETASITVTISAIVPNAPPVVTGSAAVSYVENGTASAATYTATDPEEDEVTWSVKGTDAVKFEINESGELSFKSPPDYEKPLDTDTDNVYEVTITASDGNLESTLNTEVTVTNVDEAVTITGSATVSYAENSTASVAKYAGTDPEGNEVTWSMTGADAAKFSISTTGELTFKSPPDYETPGDANEDNVYEVTITASDGNLESTRGVEIAVRNINEAVIFTGSTTFSYAEHDTASVATYSATDPEGAEITWSVKGSDAAQFSISESAELTFDSVPDYEKPRDANTDNVYAVTVTASDGSLESTLEVEVTVTNVNEVPSFTGSATVSYPENKARNVATYFATDPEGAEISWSIAGTDSAWFEISESGELTFDSPPDYENPRDADTDNVYAVTVTASDGSLESTLDIQVTVTNVNEAPSITGPTAVNYAENGSTTVAVYSATDPDGDGITWDIEGTDAARFEISELGELSFKTPPDYEEPRDGNKDKVYEVTVTASDGDLSSRQDVEVTVTNVNEAPSISGDSAVNYPENGTTNLATYSATDPEGDGITWSIAGVDAVVFGINETGELSFKSAPDFEKPLDADNDSMYEVTVTASDGNLESTRRIEITVTNVNEAPSISGSATVNYAENGTAPVATYTATDPEGDAITWSVAGSDAAWFEISESGELSFNSSPDHEQPLDANEDNMYEVTVTASDGNLESARGVEVTVTDVVEAIVIRGLASVSYVENGMDAAAKYMVTDPKGAEITWSIAGIDEAWFGISESGQLSFNASPDHEKPLDANEDNVYEVAVRASDGNLESARGVEITVTNVNEAPSITGSATVSYKENSTTAVSAYSATDPEGGGITWSVAGADAAWLEISEAGGLSFKSPPDYENPRDADNDNVYEVTVTASDGNLESTLRVEITVMNVNEAPTITDSASMSYPENGATGVAKYIATDPEGNGITWSVAGTDAAWFEIGESGKLSFNSPPDYEKPLDANEDNVYAVTVTASDGNLESTLEIEVTVTDANDAPRFPSRAIVTEIPENSCPGAHTLYRGVGRTDEDGDTLTYALSGADARFFVIHLPTGYVTLDAGKPLDFETSREPFVLHVSVSDGRDDMGDPESGFVADDSFELTVAITDVNEPPVFTEARLTRDPCGRPVRHEPGQLRRVVTAGARGGSPVGTTLSVVDPEGEPVRFRIVSQSDQGAFIIDSTSGQIMVAPDFSPRDARRVFTLRVAATDGELESEIEVRIAVKRAPKPTPEPDVEDSPRPNPESTNDTEAPTPVQSDENTDDSSSSDESDTDLVSTPETIGRLPVILKQVEPVFVPVPGAVQVPRFAAAEVQDQTGRVRLTAPAGTLAVPYQVRLTQDEAVCVRMNEATSLLGCVCVSVEFFDAGGALLSPESLNRPALLEIVLRTRDDAGNSESEEERAEISRDSIGVMMRQGDEREWAYAHGELRGPADGSSILMVQVRSPGQYMALVTESENERDAPAGEAPMNFLRTAVAQQAQNTVIESIAERAVSFVYDPLAAHPRSQPSQVVSADPQAWHMARLLIALLLDVTVALSAGIFLQRMTFRRR